MKILTFQLGKEIYSINIEDVSFVSNVEEIIDYPGTKSFIRGISDVKKRVMTIIDLKEYLFHQEAEITSESKIIVVPYRDSFIGLLVDEANNIEEIQKDQIHQLSITGGNISRSISIVKRENTKNAENQKKLIILLNIKMALDDEEIQKAIQEVQKEKEVKY